MIFLYFNIIYRDKPNLFFFDMIDCAKVGPAVVTNGCPTKQVCVAECPTTYWTWYVQVRCHSFLEAKIFETEVTANQHDEDLFIVWLTPSYPWMHTNEIKHILKN